MVNSAMKFGDGAFQSATFMGRNVQVLKKLIRRA
jgi:hypothetical protein